MKKEIISTWLNYLIAVVWIINGLFCKVLNLVPRHQEIVARVVDSTHARLLTLLIGFAEIGMAAWIVSGYRARLNAQVQIIIVAAMNILEFILVPDLLFWGKTNIVFAFMFIIIIYYKEFRLNKMLNHEAACYPS